MEPLAYRMRPEHLDEVIGQKASDLYDFFNEAFNWEKWDFKKMR